MKYDFDTLIDRHGTKSLKYDFAKERGRDEDILPLWVADMDFRTVPEVSKRLAEAALYGITATVKRKRITLRRFASWYEKHFNWNPEAEWLIKTPGVVFAIAAAVRAFTKPGEGVLIQQPVYYPFSEQSRITGACR